jgi:hypothetical protein
MTPQETNDFVDVWHRVRQWPEPMQISLATRILQSLEDEQSRTTSRKSLADLIGIWDTGGTPPTDEQLRGVLEEELLKKYG